MVGDGRVVSIITKSDLFEILVETLSVRKEKSV